MLCLLLSLVKEKAAKTVAHLEENYIQKVFLFYYITLTLHELFFSLCEFLLRPTVIAYPFILCIPSFPQALESALKPDAIEAIEDWLLTADEEGIKDSHLKRCLILSFSQWPHSSKVSYLQFNYLIFAVFYVP